MQDRTVLPERTPFDVVDEPDCFEVHVLCALFFDYPFVRHVSRKRRIEDRAFDGCGVRRVDSLRELCRTEDVR